jgi:GGDEF domain-containing protein
LSTIIDITEQSRADERVRFMAHHDLLTSLPNRALFLEKTDDAGTRLRQRGEMFAVFMLDLDRFKDVNDSLGHPAGDALLKDTARRLKSVLNEGEVLARLGGDEFAILQPIAADGRWRPLRWRREFAKPWRSPTTSSARRSSWGPASGSRWRHATGSSRMN